LADRTVSFKHIITTQNTEQQIIMAVTQEIINKSMTYRQYNQKIEKLYAEGKTTNNDNTESMLGYTKLNIQRVNRWDAKAVLTDESMDILQSVNKKLTWLVLSEGWCGDSAQILPFINKMAEQNDDISLRVIFRDEYPEVMDAFLTNGTSRSIPKIVILNSETLEVLGEWGPRPSSAQKTFMDEKNNPEIGGAMASKNLHVWYARDKGKTIQQDFLTALEQILV
jgi:hypothetical protein